MRRWVCSLVTYLRMRTVRHMGSATRGKVAQDVVQNTLVGGHDEQRQIHVRAFGGFYAETVDESTKEERRQEQVLRWPEEWGGCL